MKLHRGFNRLFGLMVMGLILAGCNLPESSPAPTPDIAHVVSSTQTAIAIDTIIAPSAPVTPQSVGETPAAETPAGSTASPSTPTSTPTATGTSAAATATQQPDCSDLATLVSETVPDGTMVKPGEHIQKTWRLRNAGDCTWNNGYTLVFKDGSQMDAASPQTLQNPVAPGEIIELQANFIAPALAGTYRSDWILVNAAGQEFGLGLNGNRPFWAEITVTDSGASLDLGTPDWRDGFDADLNRFYLKADDAIEFAIEDGKLVLTAFQPSGDNWRVAELSEIGDFYLETKASFGETCSGKDSFGFLVRAPKQPGNVVDTGYVFAFSCDGNFRYYRMDDGEYVGLQNWKPAANLNAGAGQSNQVGVWAEGDQFRIYINGERVAEFSDATYDRGLFGLLIRSEKTDDFTVAIDEMSYWLLP